MAGEKKGSEKSDDTIHVDLGIGDLGLGGLFKGIEEFLNFASELEKEKRIHARLLNDVNKLIGELQKEIQEDGAIKTVKKTKANPLKTMPIGYRRLRIAE
jgi:hypothetical protein